MYHILNILTNKSRLRASILLDRNTFLCLVTHILILFFLELATDSLLMPSMVMT